MLREYYAYLPSGLTLYFKCNRVSFEFCQAVLGPEAKEDEINVVEVEAMGYKSDVKYPITVLRGGVQHQSLLDLLFPDPPVTFKLIKGSGPVHLLGNHSVGSEYKHFRFASLL